jgi:hypothetical protein
VGADEGRREEEEEDEEEDYEAEEDGGAMARGRGRREDDKRPSGGNHGARAERDRSLVVSNTTVPARRHAATKPVVSESGSTALRLRGEVRPPPNLHFIYLFLISNIIR